MRILAVSNLGPRAVSPWEGGFIAKRIYGLQASGHDVVLVKPDWTGVAVNLALQAYAGGGRVHAGTAVQSPEPVWRLVRVPVRPWEVPGGVIGDPRSATARIASAIEAAHGRQGFDVIQAHGMYAFWAGGVAEHLSERLGTPFTVTLHGSDLNGLRRWRRRAFRRIMGRAAGAMFVSDALRRTALRQELAPGPTAVTPNGFDGSVFHPRGRSPSDRLRIIFVGNLTAVKGADRLPGLLQAVRELEPSARLEVLGDGPLLPRLQERLRGTRATFLGRVEPAMVAQRMRDSDVLVVPSRSEGWGCVITEARACGTRVVGSAVGGIPEAVGDGGALVPATFEPRQAAHAVLAQWRRTDIDRIAASAQQYEWEVLGGRESDILRRWLG